MSKILYFGNLPLTTSAADLTKLVRPHAEVINTDSSSPVADWEPSPAI